MQYHAILCNTTQYHAIPCNTIQYYAILCKTMQYHASLITADGAYHCPVGSIMAIFMILLLFGNFKGIFQSIFWIFLISQQLQYALQALMFIYYVPVNRKLIYTSVTFPLFVQESRRTNICLIALIVVCCLLPYFYQRLCITLKETCLTLFWYVMIAHCPKLKS